MSQAAKVICGGEWRTKGDGDVLLEQVSCLEPRIIMSCSLRALFIHAIAS